MRSSNFNQSAILVIIMLMSIVPIIVLYNSDQSLPASVLSDQTQAQASSQPDSQNQADTKTSDIYLASAGYNSDSSNVLSYTTSNGQFPKQYSTYQLAFDHYENKILQITNCVATVPRSPSDRYFQGGTQIMVEGKSPDPQIVYVGDLEVFLAGYDFAIVTLPKVSATQTISIDCEINESPQYNIASIALYP